MLIIFVDGWCRRNGLPGAFGGWSFRAFQDGIEVALRRGMLGEDPQTNNHAEWTAVCRALKFVREVGDEAKIVTDSQLIVVNQLREGHHAKSPHIRRCWTEAVQLIDEIESLGYSVTLEKADRHEIRAVLGH